MFVRNSWYVAAYSDQVGRAPLDRLLLEQPVVLFRKQDGTPVALEDRCVHRSVPLSMGNVIGDTIQCVYHGLVYDCAGTCIKIPGQVKVPQRARVRSYPLVERYGCIWIWMGDAELADATRIPDFHWLTDPGWRVTKTHVEVQAHYQLVIDNLLDLSHVAYLHASTVGTDEVGDLAEVKTEPSDDGITVTRWTLDVPAARTYAEFGAYEGNIDRWQISRFIPPCFFTIDNGSAATGTGAPEGKPGEQRWGFRVCHGITPATETSTNYFWALAHEFAAEDGSAKAEFYRQCHHVVGEDIAVFEAQQKAIERRPDVETIDIQYDAGPLQARRLIARLVEAEAAGV